MTTMMGMIHGGAGFGLFLVVAAVVLLVIASSGSRDCGCNRG